MRMPPVPVLAIVLLAASHTTSADLSAGVRLGLNLATVTGDVEDEFLTVTPGVAASLDLQLSLASWLALETGVAYTTRGARWSYDESDATDDTRVGYLAVPLSGLCRVPREWPVVPYACLGADLAFFLGASRTVKIDGNEIHSGSPNEGARTLDVGIMLGGGVDIPLGAGKVRVDARYTWGMLTVDASGDEWVKNRVLSFSAGYLWDFGREGHS